MACTSDNRAENSSVRNVMILVLSEVEFTLCAETTVDVAALLQPSGGALKQPICVVYCLNILVRVLQLVL